MSWLVENWRHILGVLWLVAVFLVVFYFYRHPEAAGARIVFFLVPSANPNRPRPALPGLRALLLWALGLFIVLMTILFVPGFV
jgi:hypothetical protein